MHRSMVRLSIAALAILTGACSSDNVTPNGSGGSVGRGGSQTGGSPATGGSGVGGSGSGGAVGSGGKTGSGGAAGGSATGGAAAGTGGGTSAGGRTGSTGGNTAGGGATSSGGATGAGGSSSVGGQTGSGGSNSDAGKYDVGISTIDSGGSSGTTCTLGSCLPGNAPIPSSGCGKALGTLKTGSKTITSGGSSRKYAIDIPTNYDPNHPYRLFFTWHWIGASQDVLVNGVVESINGTGVNGGADKYAFYGLKRQAQEANDPAIFIAPSSNGSMWDFSKDGPLFEALLALASNELCIDTSRVFSTGFSFGAMMTYALSISHQKQLRAAVGMAAANYNLPGAPTDNGQPIAYMGTTGMSDGTCPYVNSDASKQGGKYCALAHAQDNGCTIPTTITTTTTGSKTHVCYDFQGCKPGYPVKMCTFDGSHQCNVADGGTTNDGLKSWIPTESWKFFSQF